MLQQSIEQVYWGILLTFNREIPYTHFLKKLERKSARFFPQILQALPNKQNLECLDMAYDSQVISKFNIEEVCNVRLLINDVKILIEVSKAIFEEKQNRHFLKYVPDLSHNADSGIV